MADAYGDRRQLWYRRLIDICSASIHRRLGLGDREQHGVRHCNASRMVEVVQTEDSEL